jgi:hypothetical protein
MHLRLALMTLLGLWTAGDRGLLAQRGDAAGTAPVLASPPRSTLPLLAGREVRPANLPGHKEGEDWSLSAGVWEVPASEQPADGPGFTTAEEAFAATRDWLRRHVFADLPEGSVVIRCDDFEREHATVFWTQTFADVPAGGRGWIAFRGKTPVRGNVSVYELVPIAGSEKPLLAAAAAREAWEKGAANVGATIDRVVEKGHMELLPVPQLHYHEALQRAEQEIGGRKYTCVLHPTWFLDKDAYYLGVDAHTGAAWYETDSQPLPQKPVTGSEWQGKPPTTGAPMELWRGKLRAPVLDADDFESEHSLGYRYPKERRDPKPPTEDPYPTDAEAVLAVKDWIVRHFGPLPAGSELLPTSIDHSSSGGSKPKFDWDRGHTIVLQQVCSGHPTDNMSIVYLTGRKRFEGTIRIVDMTPIAGSAAPTVTKEVARQVMRAAMESSGASRTKSAIAARLLFPHLEYRTSIVHRDDKHGESEIYAPTWVFGRRDGVLVDAITGRIWRDD